MKISVVTPSYNQALFINNAILSIINQSFPCYEYLVIDGNSTDATLEVLKHYNPSHLSYTSEKDNGQANALNKGFSIASGDIFCWLNADDVFLPGAFEKINDYFTTHPECEWLAGNCVFTDIFLNPVWNYTVPSIDAKDYMRFWEGMYLSQPSVFFRKELWQKSGGLNESLHYALDHDLWLNFFQLAPLHILHENLSINRIYPQTKTSTGKEKALHEIISVLSLYSEKMHLGYSQKTIEKKLRTYFITGEMGIFRSQTDLTVKSLFSYHLSFTQKIRALASALKTTIKHW